MMETDVNCVVDTKDEPLWWQQKGLQQTASGYGTKLTTRRMLLYRAPGERTPRWRRVYVTTFGNMGTAWIIVAGQRVALDPDTEALLLEGGL